MGNAKEPLMRTLGLTRRAVDYKLGLVWGTSVRLEWLRTDFSNVIDADKEVWIKCIVKAYLLYLIGCTLFSDKSEPRISVLYVRLFVDLGVVSTYTWSTTTLAYLYRQLGYASRGGIKHIASYLPLLEILLVFNTCLKKFVLNILLILEIFETDMDIRAFSYNTTPTQYGIYEWSSTCLHVGVVWIGGKIIGQVTSNSWISWLLASRWGKLVIKQLSCALNSDSNPINVYFFHM